MSKTSLNNKNLAGFTLVEMLMTILVVGILSALAIPALLDYRIESKNAATQNALGVIRTGIAIQYGQTLTRCGGVAGNWPNAAALNANDITAGAVCDTTMITNPSDRAFVAASVKLPVNPWGASPPINTVTACGGAGCTNTNKCSKNCAGGGAGPTGGGWCYNPANGTIWANSASNGSSPAECSY